MEKSPEELRYSEEKAYDEASKMKEVLDKSKFLNSDYSRAEEIVEHEKSQLLNKEGQEKKLVKIIQNLGHYKENLSRESFFNSDNIETMIGDIATILSVNVKNGIVKEIKIERGEWDDENYKNLFVLPSGQIILGEDSEGFDNYSTISKEQAELTLDKTVENKGKKIEELEKQIENIRLDIERLKTEQGSL
ncbi:MAG: hypothetical protein M0P97_04625 [Candidatus Moranbacteria bacterium]|jgi:hypothetical protein|nr:hypothetical protein [Candidatus Moranbacteria bacterium]